MEFEQFANELAELNEKEELKYQRKLEMEFVELETKFERDKKALDEVMPAAEYCRAPVEQFYHLISGRLYCFTGMYSR